MWESRLWQGAARGSGKFCQAVAGKGAEVRRGELKWVGNWELMRARGNVG